MLDVKELEKTKLVNIVGEIPNVRLQILECNGDIKEFRLREMKIAGARTEIDKSNQAACENNSGKKINKETENTCKSLYDDKKCNVCRPRTCRNVSKNRKLEEQ